MAFGMKQWLGVVLVGLALVAVWRLPPEPPELRDRTVPTAEEIRYEALRDEERVTVEILQRMLWSDSLSARVVEEERDGIAVLAPPMPPGPEEQLRRFESMVRRQVAERASGPMVFGFVFQPHHQSRVGRGLAPRQSRTETYVGSRDGTDYCLQVRVADGRHVDRVIARRLTRNDETHPHSDDLGPCRFYLTYGLAGSGVQAWLERGAVEFAVEGGGEAPTLAPMMYTRRTALGFTYFGDRTSIEVTRCMAGVASSCADFLEVDSWPYFISSRQQEVVRRSPLVGTSGFWTARRWTPDQAYLLADLEAEFGPDAFRSFCISDAPVPEAFEAAFGVDTGTWMTSWVERTVGIDRPGPGLPGEASTGAALTVLVLLGMAYWRRKERGLEV